MFQLQYTTLGLLSAAGSRVSGQNIGLLTGSDIIYSFEIPPAVLIISLPYPYTTLTNEDAYVHVKVETRMITGPCKQRSIRHN